MQGEIQDPNRNDDQQEEDSRDHHHPVGLAGRGDEVGQIM
jgi:hypothetical protein